MVCYEDSRYNIYTELGYADRYDYFTTLSKTFDIPVMEIILKAEQLGMEQDFNELLDWVGKINGNVIR